jgi:Lon protease-like protein
MRRALPAKPNLEHLKSQAKDLLDAHRRGEPEALARIRDAVPAFAHKSDADIARASFALHDAQSAIAREYGFVSWAELRSKIAAGEAEQQTPVNLITGAPVPPEIEAELRAVSARLGEQRDEPTPPILPVVPLRNAVVFPGSLVPIDISRASSMQAIEAAQRHQPAFIAVFAQRAIDIEQPTSDDLHTRGTLCVAHLLSPSAAPPAQAAPAAPGEPARPRLASMILEGVRWIGLDGFEQTEPYFVARVTDLSDDSGDAAEIAALDRQLRELAHRFADTMGGIAAQVHAMIDNAKGAGELANLVVAHVPIPVSEKAAFAAETQLSRKLDRAIAVIGPALAQVLAARPG